MNGIDNPMVQVARMYQMIEAHLRRAATDDVPISMGELGAKDDVREHRRTEWQYREIVRSLIQKGFVTVVGSGPNTRYKWNLEAPPFILSQKKRERIMTDPSEGTTTKIQGATAVRNKANREVEFVFNGVEFVVGINPTTGNLRLKIEQT